MKDVKMMMSVVSGFLPLMFVSAAFAEETETPLSWYLTQNCGNDTFGPSTSMEYWAEGSINGAKGETTDSLNGKDYYYVIDKTFTSKSGKGYVFPGASLTLGDDTSSGNMIIRGSAATFTNLVLKSGYITHASVKSVSDDIKRYDNILGTTTVKSSKTDPFVIKSICSKLWMTWQGKITGDENAGLSIGTADSRNRFLISITNAAAYSGDIVVKSALTNSGRSFGSGLGVKGSIPGTIRLASGTIIKTHDHNASAELGELHMDEGSQMRFVYDSTKMTGGTIRVTRALTLPEKVIVHAMNGAADDAWTPPTSLPEEVCHPFLVGPPGKRIDPNIFEFVPDSTYEPENNPDFNPLPQRLHFEVETDPVSDRDTVYAVLEPFVELEVADEYSRMVGKSSAFEKAGSWSDKSIPTVGRHYFISKDLQSTSDDVDYVFPGKSFIHDGGRFVIGGQRDVVISNYYWRWGTIYTMQGANIVLKGKMSVFEPDNKEHESKFVSWASRPLDINADISGTGDLHFDNFNTDSATGIFTLSGNNSEYKGKIYVSNSYSGTVDINGKRCVNLHISNAGNLGGALNTFTYNALSLSGYARLIPTDTMTLPKMLNRGVFVNGNGVIAPGEGASLRIECPITMNGTLHKAGLGVLEMAGEIRFYDAENKTSVETPRNEADVLELREGTLKIASTNACNGLCITVYDGTSILLPKPGTDADLDKYGLYNVKAGAAPFVLAEGVSKLPIAFEEQLSADSLEGMVTNALFTVANSAVDSVRAMLPYGVKPYQGVRASIVEIPLADEEATTFACVTKRYGLVISIK